MLIKELQSLGLDVVVLDKDRQEIDLKQNFDDDDDIDLNDGDTILEEDEVITVSWMPTPWRTTWTMRSRLTIPAQIDADNGDDLFDGDSIGMIFRHD